MSDQASYLSVLETAYRETQAENERWKEENDILLAQIRLDQAENERLREALAEIASCSPPESLQEQIALAALGLLAPADKAKYEVVDAPDGEPVIVVHPADEAK